MQICYCILGNVLRQKLLKKLIALPCRSWRRSTAKCISRPRIRLTQSNLNQGLLTKMTGTKPAKFQFLVFILLKLRKRSEIVKLANRSFDSLYFSYQFPIFLFPNRDFPTLEMKSKV